VNVAVSASPALGVAGLMATPVTTGAELRIITVLDVTVAPEAEPSEGETVNFQA